jgi:hypothetical protein
MRGVRLICSSSIAAFQRINFGEQKVLATKRDWKKDSVFWHVTRNAGFAITCTDPVGPTENVKRVDVAAPQ